RALAGTAPPPAPSANPMYPDLITWTDWLRDIDMVDSNGRKLLRFSASYANTGRGPMEVYGVVQGDGTTYAYQRVWNDDGTYTDYLAGTFSFAGHQDHNHWHFDDFASYYLRRVTSSGGVGSIVAGSPKITFCLLDWTPYDRSLPGAPQNAVYTCDNQGISVGWADVYVKELEGQNIDITSVPDGVYWLESVTDPDNRLKEASDSNNSGRIKIQFSKSNNTVTFVDDTGGGTVVWVEDALPAGAVAYADGGDSWNWVASNPAPFSGSRAHQSNIGLGLHQHYFDWANATLNVAAGDKLFTYIFIDPLNVPEEVMLQWNDGSWEHRAYWGANRISYGTDGTASRRHMGALPPAGQWVRLEVPAVAVGLEGRTLKGMAFTLFGGRATWDYSGKEGN
ncbi:MAG TPA: lysyl oxidase family protein, partial [Methylomirabilota bacterium]|nr:lysyl oxidase family protein [Methylomirabilota bacterium]